MMSTPYEFRAFTFGTVFAFGGSFPFPNPIQTREAETGNSPFYALLEAESKPRPSITLQTVPSIIETTLTSATLTKIFASRILSCCRALLIQSRIRIATTILGRAVPGLIHTEKGQKAAIDLKLNNLTDPDMIGLLYDAAAAGVYVRLNVRGMYSVLPPSPEHRKNIEAIGIIDRLMEHTRIFAFENGGEPKLFLSSGDWMTRNLDRRVELTFPVYDSVLQGELQKFLDIQWHDNVKARVLDDDLINQYRPRKGGAVRAQTAFYELLKGKSPEESEEQALA